MKLQTALIIAVMLISLAGSRPLPAQRSRAGRSGTANSLYGTLSVKEASPGASGALTFSVILVAENGTVMDRQQVSANGGYRFLYVPNGVYDLVVERDGNQVAKVQILVQELRPTDIRKDLALEWKAEAVAGGNLSPSPTTDGYNRRSGENVARFAEAIKAGQAKDRARATALLREIVKQDPNDYEAWTELGTMEFLGGNHGEADKAYTKSLEGRPAYLPALLNLGRLRMAQKNYDAAIEVLLRATQAQPNSSDAHLLLGESYLQVKKGSKAVTSLNEALRLDPVGKAEAHLRLATLYNAAGMKNRAASEYAQFLQKRPEYPEKKKLEEYIRQYK